MHPKVCKIVYSLFFSTSTWIERAFQFLFHSLGSHICWSLRGKALRPMLCAPLNWKRLMSQAVTFFGWMVMSRVRLDGVPIKQELHIACLFVYSLVYISYVFSLACSSFRCVCFLCSYGCHHISWNIKHQSHVSDLDCINLFGFHLEWWCFLSYPSSTGRWLFARLGDLGRFLKKCLQKNSGGVQV